MTARRVSFLCLLTAWSGLAAAYGTVRRLSLHPGLALPPLHLDEDWGDARESAAKALSDHLRTTADAPTDDPPLRSTAQIIFPGGGIFFYWQAGAVTHLRERGYDLSSVDMSGASAGALTATLAAADVDFFDATDRALSLAHEAGVWDRPLGLQGVWGGLIERWLDDLLPEDAHERANRVGLRLLVTPVPSFGKTAVEGFVDRTDLIRANMASIHIPWFLDGKLTTTYRDAEHIDGSFLAKATDYISKVRPKRVVRLDWTKDPAMSNKKLGDFVQALSKEGIWDLMEKGRSHAEVMEERGDFDSIPRL